MKKNVILGCALIFGFCLFAASCTNRIDNEVSSMDSSLRRSQTSSVNYGDLHNDILSICLSKFHLVDIPSMDSYMSSIIYNTQAVIEDETGHNTTNCIDHVMPFLSISGSHVSFYNVDSVLSFDGFGMNFVPILYEAMKEGLLEIEHDTTSTVLTTRARMCQLCDLLIEKSRTFGSFEAVEQTDVVTQIMLGSYDYWTSYSNMVAWGNESYTISPREHIVFDDITLSRGQLSEGTKNQVLRFVEADASGAFMGYPFGGIYGSVAIGSIFSALEALSW